MKETVLLYNFNDKDRLMKIRQALLPLGFRVKTVGREDYGKPLGTLAGVKGMEELTEADHSGDGLCSDFDDEMAVLAGLTALQNKVKNNAAKKGKKVTEAASCGEGCASCSNGACSGKVFPTGNEE